MKKFIESYLLLIISIAVVIASCSEDGENLTPLTANAGADQTVAPFTVVTLDGSASTGPDDSFSYQWSLSSGQSDVFLNNPTSSEATFEPKTNGIYTFLLRITSGSQFSEDQVTITVTGAVSLSGVLTENLTLKDIEPGAGPDYIITSDLVVPSEKTITLPSNGQIVLQINENAGIIIDGGNVSTGGSAVEFNSASGWKGFLLKSGNLTLTTGNIFIKNAGKTTFDGQTETAAITALGGTLNLTGVQFTGSTGYDLLIPEFLSNASVSTNTFTAAKPIKTSIGMLAKLDFNNFASPYDYIVLNTPGAGTSVAALGGLPLTFRSGVKYYVDGDFTAGSPIEFQSANPTTPTTILMKPGAGILASAGINTGSNTVFDGLNGEPWKGIAITGGSSGSSLSGTKIKNAGSAVFNTGAFTSDVKAAIYYAGDNGGGLNNCEISNSQGYGLYNASVFSYMSSAGTYFTGTALPAISLLGSQVHAAISNAENTFSVPVNVPAVEVRVPNAQSRPLGTWQSLGGNNFYLFSANVTQEVQWILKPGVNLKFKAGKSLTTTAVLTAVGTAESPITFDSEAGTIGTWGGIMVQSRVDMQFCQIKNGGETLLFKNGVTQATELANIVFDFSTGANTHVFKNNTISNSNGYGVLIEATRQNPDVLNVANSNVFNSNNTGTVIVK